MSSSVRSFFKVILASTLREGKLKIPSKFVTEHGEEISDSVRLFLPMGRSWCVGVERDVDKTIWLQDGLLKFLEDNSVGIEYFLIFEYEGNSMFNVLIFDLTSTEVDYVCNRDSAKCSYADQVQVPDTGEGGADGGSKERSFEFLASSTDYRCNQISDESASRITRETNNIKQCYVTRRKKQKLNGDIEAKDADDYFTPPRKDMDSQSYEGMHKTTDVCKGDRKTCRKTYNCGSNSLKYKDTKVGDGSYISPEECSEERSDNAENMSFPSSFEVTLKAFNLNNYILAVPTEFARLNIPRSTSLIKLLDADDMEWEVRLVHQNKRQCSLSKGWIRFARDKKLMVGDICVFERIGGREVKLKVNIYRSADKNSMLYKDTSRNDGTDAYPREFVKERAIETENKLRLSSFKVTLKPGNIEKHILRVPSYFTPLITFNSASLIKLVDADNNEWAVRYIYKPRNHALTQGFMNFVRDKKLTVGDICTFERVCYDDKVKLKVSISKSIK